MSLEETVVYVRASRAEVYAAIDQVAPAAAGGSGAREAHRALLCRMGLAAQGRIRKAFVVKAAHGTDEAGERWAKLSPYTIAYRRRHPGVPKAAQRASKRPSWNLSEAQRTRWWNIYYENLKRYNGDKGSAARFAWFVLKSEGARTLLDQYGDTDVEILRDTGLLLNSLSPGIDLGPDVTTVPDKKHQIFRIGQGEIIIGTNRKGALDNHEGRPSQNLPKRALWPSPNKWPSSWWSDVLTQAQQGLIDITLWFLR